MAMYFRVGRCNALGPQRRRCKLAHLHDGAHRWWKTSAAGQDWDNGHGRTEWRVA